MTTATHPVPTSTSLGARVSSKARDDVALARLALAAVALHVADDNFLQPKEVPGSGHIGGVEAQPAEYERRVVGFFDRTLLDR
jgi:hypothetical protein